MEVPEHSIPQTCFRIQQKWCNLAIRQYSQRFSKEKDILSPCIP
jgi:hypothetical protein